MTESRTDLPVVDDDWLEPWLPVIHQHSHGHPVLELGCGEGRDTRFLVGQGIPMIAADLQHQQLVRAANECNAMFFQADLRNPLPFRDRSFHLVLASLCLHYFTWELTCGMVAEIRRLLTSRGLILLRVNAFDDVHFGAGQGAPIEPGLYLWDGRQKRFFERRDIFGMLEGFEPSHVEHKTIDRYDRPKRVWEVLARRR